MRTKEMILCGLFAAMICISTVFTIPLPFTPVPITLQVMAVCVSGALLGAKRGGISVLVYILIGFTGIPVFSGMKGGPNVLFGATGGYIIGFIPAAMIIGFLLSRYDLKDSTAYKLCAIVLSMLAGLFVIYAVGTVQLMFLTDMSLSEALMAAVIPFIPLDLLKIACASAVTYFVRENAYASKLLEVRA